MICHFKNYKPIARVEHALCILFVIAFLPAQAAEQRYRVVDLGAVTTQITEGSRQWKAVNDAQEVAGTEYVRLNGMGASVVPVPIRWSGGAVTRLLEPTATTFAGATDIAANGAVAGGLFAPGNASATVWPKSGSRISVGFASQFAAYVSLSDHGVFAGWFDGDDPSPIDTIFRASPSGYSAETLQTAVSIPNDLAVNDFGYVVVDAGGNGKGRLWTASAMDIGVSPESAHAINNLNEVVGRAAEGGPAIWRGTGPAQSLPLLPGGAAMTTTALAINDAGTIVGTSGTIGVVWEKGIVTDLSTLIPTTDGWTAIQSASDISPNGTILASGLKNGVPHACLLVPSAFNVTLDIFASDGSPVDGKLEVSHDFRVLLKIENDTDGPISNFRFEGGAPLTIDGRSTGGIAISNAPTFDPTISLDTGESLELTFDVTTTEVGVAAVLSKLTVDNSQGDDLTDAHSLLFNIEDPEVITDAIGEYIVLRAIDDYLFKSVRALQAGMRDRAQKLFVKLSKVLDPAERAAWFGPDRLLTVSPRDQMLALQRGIPAEVVAAQTPKNPFKGHTVEELNQAYDDTFREEVGKGLKKWVKGYAKLGKAATEHIKQSYIESFLDAKYLMFVATPDERLQMEAYWSTFARGVKSDTKTLIKAVRAEIPKWKEDGTALVEALIATNNALYPWNIKKNGESMLTRIAENENQIRTSLLKMADKDPVGFQRAWAKRDAAIMNGGLPLILDTLLGAGVAKVATVSGKVVQVGGKGASVLEAGRSAGYLDTSGAVIEGSNAAIVQSGAAELAGTSLHQAARLEADGGLLANTAGATLVQASDFGNVYRLPNLGGVPEKTLDAKAAILGEIETAYQSARGSKIKLVEVLKTSSPLRKPGDVAKLELTAGKTGKPAMVDAGMPQDALAEAVYWHSPTSPELLPGFAELPKARQDAALKEWQLANERWVKFENPPAGSKEAKLKSVIGQRNRVPLDDAPNSAGLQRFVNAEFEEVLVTKGDAEAKLIRVKHYEIEVVDTTRNNTVVNRKTVIDNLATSAPQTADADAVAVGKVVGTDPATGAPIVAPLDRAEREFVMSRYIDKNVKARRSGAIPDLAEHGVTLVMEDASAKAAGFLLPSYGVPFMPELIGKTYLQRIAPFVKPTGYTDEQMLEKMLELVKKEGGFGQHAVVVTSDSRYLGEVPFANW